MKLGDPRGVYVRTTTGYFYTLVSTTPV